MPNDGKTYNLSNDSYLEDLHGHLYNQERTTCNEPTEVNVLIQDEAGIGFGYVYDNGDSYIALMYQDRLDLTLATKEMFEKLNEGKAQLADSDDMIESVNEILKYWFIEPIPCFVSLPNFDTTAEAIEYLNQSGNHYLIYTTKE